MTDSVKSSCDEVGRVRALGGRTATTTMKFCYRRQLGLMLTLSRLTGAVLCTSTGEWTTVEKSRRSDEMRRKGKRQDTRASEPSAVALPAA